MKTGENMNRAKEIYKKSLRKIKSSSGNWENKIKIFLSYSPYHCRVVTSEFNSGFGHKEWTKNSGRVVSRYSDLIYFASWNSILNIEVQSFLWNFGKISLLEQRGQLLGLPNNLTSLLTSEIYDFCSLDLSSLPASNLLATCPGRNSQSWLRIAPQSRLEPESCMGLRTWAGFLWPGRAPADELARRPGLSPSAGEPSKIKEHKKGLHFLSPRFKCLALPRGLLRPFTQEELSSSNKIA